MNRYPRSWQHALNSGTLLVLLLVLAALSALGQAPPVQDPLINEDDATLPETGLGTVLSEVGRPDQALNAHARALQLEPEDEENFHGWAQALLDLNMLGDATRPYESLRDTRPKQTATLMNLMKSWLAEKRTDPGELDPADVERLADWIELQEEDTG